MLKINAFTLRTNFSLQDFINALLFEFEPGEFYPDNIIADGLYISLIEFNMILSLIIQVIIQDRLDLKAMRDRHLQNKNKLTDYLSKKFGASLLKPIQFKTKLSFSPPLQPSVNPVSVEIPAPILTQPSLQPTDSQSSSSMNESRKRKHSADKTNAKGKKKRRVNNNSQDLEAVYRVVELFYHFSIPLPSKNKFKDYFGFSLSKLQKALDGLSEVLNIKVDGKKATTISYIKEVKYLTVQSYNDKKSMIDLFMEFFNEIPEEVRNSYINYCLKSNQEPYISSQEIKDLETKYSFSASTLVANLNVRIKNLLEKPKEQLSITENVVPSPLRFFTPSPTSPTGVAQPGSSPKFDF